ncbi:MAG TPA: VTT domain-containing protein [Pseudonocardiaceae bacterium]|nr:VTT domain-containing protein [Pseudonocardiaceae bacterium]
MTTHSLAATAVLGIKWLDPNYLVGSLGAWVVPMVAIIIFAECGILLGFLLPGDSLLFPLGLFIARGVVHTPLWLACLIMAACAVAGNVVGYLVGYVIGPRLFNKPDSRLFKREHVDRTHLFFERYGVAAILLGRFVPIVRTFITAVAGVARMAPAKYLTVSVVGGVLWAAGIVVAGYFLGRIDFIGNHIDLILSLIVVISVVPVVIEWARHRKERKLAADVTQPIMMSRR